MTRRITKTLVIVGLVLFAGVVGAAMFLAEGALHIPERRRFAASRDLADRIALANGARWTEQRITAADGASLVSWQFTPTQGWNGATVLLLHGHFDTREGPAGFAPMLLRNGYAALIPDNRGHGVSGGGEVTYGIRERYDVRRWVDWALRRDGGRAQRVYALGESMGAAILLQALPGEPRIRAAVAEGAFSGFRDVAYQRVQRWYGLPDAVTGAFVEPALIYVRARYGVPLAEANPIEAIRKTQTPVLYIHGTGDTNIPPTNSDELFKARRAASQVWHPKDATHTRAMAYFPEEFESRVIGWFSSH